MKLDSLHPKSISALLFCKYLGILFSGSLDGNCIKISGLKSGILMKELNDESAAHASFIHRLLLVENNTQLLSASADGSIKVIPNLSGNAFLVLPINFRFGIINRGSVS